MDKIKKLRLGNKGTAIEMVMIAFILSFAFCTFLTLYVTRMLTYNHIITNNEEDRLFLDSVGEEFIILRKDETFVPSIINKEYFDNPNSGTLEYQLELKRKTKTYYITISDNDNKNKLIVENSSNIVCLTIEIDNNNNIISWRHGE